MRSSERLDRNFMRYNQRIILEGGLFHFLTRLTQVKELFSWIYISFFNKVEIVKELSS